MKDTNVMLSENEFSLVTDTEIILTKTRIILKVYELFANVCHNYKMQLDNAGIFLPEVTSIAPKIYKGENFMQLPYVMMDYPRYFRKQNILAIRSFFWWGNFFSISFLISGSYKAQYFALLFRKKNVAHMQDWYMYNGGDMWENNFDLNKWVLMENIPADKSLIEKLDIKPFIKIVKKIPLEKWKDSFDFFTVSYAELLKMLKD